MKVLMDFHHHDLWESMELLCARLGWTLYRPIGMEWFDEGYWNHERKWHGDAIARQYLERWGSDWFVPNVVTGGDLWGYREDPSHPNRRYKLLTLEMARNADIDIVISSLAHNHEGFARFASEVGATFGLQIGNVRFSEIDMQEDRWDLAAFGLVSGFLPARPPKPHVVYHQEFSLADFAHVPPPRGAVLRGQKVGATEPDWIRDTDGFRISSFVQCYPQDAGAYPIWLESAKRAQELDWRVYGAYGEAPLDEYAAGNLGRCADVARAMQFSDVAWHAKRWSDGYGHVIHNWFAVGRPVFGFEDYYRDQMAGPLWQDGVTSVDIGRRSPDEIVRIIRGLREDPDVHYRMSQAAANRFRQVVNFDEEEILIRDMFSQVLP